AIFVARLDRSLVRTLEQVAHASEGTQVVDMRSPGRFAGTEPEPRPGLSSGHIPGSRNLPFGTLVHSDGTALPPDELRRQLAAAGVALTRPIVATCGSGTSACTLLHALERLGTRGALYDGSWTEWAGRGMPIAHGADS